MEEKYCPGLELRTFVLNRMKQRCATDDTYSPNSQCICRKITYCLIAIIEHDLKLERPDFEVVRIMGNTLLVRFLDNGRTIWSIVDNRN